MLKLNTEYTDKWSMKWNLTKLWELQLTINQIKYVKHGVRCIRPIERTQFALPEV